MMAFMFDRNAGMRMLDAFLIECKSGFELFGAYTDRTILSYFGGKPITRQSRFSLKLVNPFNVST